MTGSWMHDVQCVCIYADDCLQCNRWTKLGGLTPCWTGCNGWRSLRKERGEVWLYSMEWGTVAWGAAALWLIRRLIFSMVFQISISILCLFTLVPSNCCDLVIWHISFCNSCTSVFCMLWFVNLLSLLSWAANFAIVFMNSLILPLPTGCLEYHSAGWGFVRPSVHSTYSSPWLPHKLKSLKFIWRCSWTPLIPKYWLRVYHNEWFRLSALSKRIAPLSHSSSSDPPRLLEDPLCFLFAPPTSWSSMAFSVQHFMATLKSLVFQEAVWNSIFSKMAV